MRIESGARRLLLILFLAEPCQRHKQDPVAQNTANPLAGLVPVEPSHPDVEDNHFRSVLLEHRERTPAVIGDSRVSTYLRDEHCRGIRRILIIVDDQNSSVEPLFIGAPLDGSEHLVRREWHLDYELATSPMSFTLGVETSAMKFHQSACEREANAQSRLRGARLSLREEIEHARQELRRDPDS